jgi:hypothetical protein
VLGVIVQQTAPHVSSFTEIADGLIIAMLTGLGVYVAKQFKFVHELREFIVGRPKSDLEPEPPPGFMEQIKDANANAATAIAATRAATAETKENSEAVLAMSTRFGQQNGTVLKIQDDVVSLHNSVANIETTLSEIAGKPPASVAEVKEALASEHEASEARQADILGAIQHDTAALVKDSKPDAGSSSRDVLDEQTRVLGEIVDEQSRVKEERRKDDEGA